MIETRNLTKRYGNLIAVNNINLKLDEGDSLVSCAITNGDNEILIATRWGKAIRFNEEEIRPTGRASRGVTGIRFGEGEVPEAGVDGAIEETPSSSLPNEPDRVIGMEVIRGNFTILSVCEGGYGKRTPLEEYRTQSRGGKGIFTIKVTERNGPVVGILQVDENDDLMVMTSSGKITRFNVNEVGVIGRLTQGVRLMAVETGEKVISLCKVQKLEGEEV